MKPENRSRTLLGMTRSKAKMFEFDLPESSHISIPLGSVPNELFLLTIANLGDVASSMGDAGYVGGPTGEDDQEELDFSARFFDAFIASRLGREMDQKALLFASAAYYLSKRPGSSMVLAERAADAASDPVQRLLHWTLLARWSEVSLGRHPIFGDQLERVAGQVSSHFKQGAGAEDLRQALKELRDAAYRMASPADLLQVDILGAIIGMRIGNSAWTRLPQFSGVATEQWASAIQRPDFPKELWPSQILLGQAGLFRGQSGVVQMPTSAGKTRSVEMVLRSAFLSGRARLAVIVAPFRALCHEIGTTLRRSFREDDVAINELSDALQMDFLDTLRDILGEDSTPSASVMVMTPEKFLYVLRQEPNLMQHVGVVVYDEGHQFDSGSRGIIYELLLTEIKELLTDGAQTVLISAVIPNASAIGAWLLGDGAPVVGGDGLLPTARSVAFVSWKTELGRLEFFESRSYNQSDYFVPRVIEQTHLAKRGRERKERVFPEKDSATDIALYLGLRLVPKGAVAVFCGLKTTASGFAGRVVELYSRGSSLPAPLESSEQAEIAKLSNLAALHFGAQASLTLAAKLGVFVHHGATPQGMRLSIEYAMQTSRIKFVACTSTLAQGVNLPIRYLIVSGTNQGGTSIKVRDFQNLIGRAGRSGMHTEGIVIFSNPEVYDTRGRSQDAWRFRAAIQLLKPEQSEVVTSSLLEIVAPFALSSNGKVLRIAAVDLCEALLADSSTWPQWLSTLASSNALSDEDTAAVANAIRSRRQLVLALESYLMANRGDGAYAIFREEVAGLASKTLAFHLASAAEKEALVILFSSVADYLERSEPSLAKQAVFAKTLLGIGSAKTIEEWVERNRDALLGLGTAEAWLSTIWPLWQLVLPHTQINAMLPDNLPQEMAFNWLSGLPYGDILERASALGGSKPYGTKRRQLTIDDVVSFCDNLLGFECALVVAAVAEFLFPDAGSLTSDAEPLLRFQKALKYGVPDVLSMSCYEAGFADRVVAQRLAGVVRDAGYAESHFPSAIVQHRQTIEEDLHKWPSYFISVLASRR